MRSLPPAAERDPRDDGEGRGGRCAGTVAAVLGSSIAARARRGRGGTVAATCVAGRRGLATPAGAVVGRSRRNDSHSARVQLSAAVADLVAPTCAGARAPA